MPNVHRLGHSFCVENLLNQPLSSNMCIHSPYHKLLDYFEWKEYLEFRFDLEEKTPCHMKTRTIKFHDI